MVDATSEHVQGRQKEGVRSASEEAQSRSNVGTRLVTGYPFPDDRSVHAFARASRSCSRSATPSSINIWWWNWANGSRP